MCATRSTGTSLRRVAHSGVRCAGFAAEPRKNAAMSAANVSSTPMGRFVNSVAISSRSCVRTAAARSNSLREARHQHRDHAGVGCGVAALRLRRDRHHQFHRKIGSKLGSGEGSYERLGKSMARIRREPIDEDSVLPIRHDPPRHRGGSARRTVRKVFGGRNPNRHRFY